MQRTKGQKEAFWEDLGAILGAPERRNTLGGGGRFWGPAVVAGGRRSSRTAWPLLETFSESICLQGMFKHYYMKGCSAGIHNTLSHAAPGAADLERAARGDRRPRTRDVPRAGCSVGSVVPEWMKLVCQCVRGILGYSNVFL